MTELLTMLTERAEEFEAHFGLAMSLEDEIFRGEDVSIGSTKLSARHLLTMKSGLIVHLYNIVEAVMTRAAKTVGSAFGSVPPKNWSMNARREWLREHGVARIEGGADARLKQMESFSTNLLADDPLGPQVIKKPPGSWTDKNIGLFAIRLGVELNMTPELYRKMEKNDKLGERTPLVFLADRRNDLAHGHRTFEDGAKDLTLSQIRELASVAFEYMQLVAISFQSYVEQKKYVVAA